MIQTIALGVYLLLVMGVATVQLLRRQAQLRAQARVEAQQYAVTNCLLFGSDEELARDFPAEYAQQVEIEIRAWLDGDYQKLRQYPGFTQVWHGQVQQFVDAPWGTTPVAALKERQ